MGIITRCNSLSLIRLYGLDFRFLKNYRRGRCWDTHCRRYYFIAGRLGYRRKSCTSVVLYGTLYRWGRAFTLDSFILLRRNIWRNLLCWRLRRGLKILSVRAVRDLPLRSCALTASGAVLVIYIDILASISSILRIIRYQVISQLIDKYV